MTVLALVSDSLVWYSLIVNLGGGYSCQFSLFYNFADSGSIDFLFKVEKKMKE